MAIITSEWGRELATWLRTDEVFAILNAQEEGDETFCDWLAGGCRLLAECLLAPLRRTFPEIRFDLEWIQTQGVPAHVLIRAQQREQEELFIDGDGVATKNELLARWTEELRAECQIADYTANSTFILDVHYIRTPNSKRQRLTEKLHQIDLQVFRPDLPGNEIQAILKQYEEIGSLLNGEQSWPCDVGALVVASLADGEGINRMLIQGTYEHPDALSYRHTTGQPYGLPIQYGSIHEAHTWIILRDKYGDWLIDPNGELRNEPCCQRLGNERYQPFPPNHELIELPPNISIATLLAENWDLQLTAAMKLLDKRRNLTATNILVQPLEPDGFGRPRVQDLKTKQIFTDTSLGRSQKTENGLPGDWHTTTMSSEPFARLLPTILLHMSDETTNQYQAS